MSKAPAGLLVQQLAHPVSLKGPIIEAPLSGVFIGELCRVKATSDAKDALARAQVIGFNRDAAVLSLLGSTQGVSRRCVIEPTGQSLMIPVSSALLGCVLDAAGTVRQRLAEPREGPVSLLKLDAAPPLFNQRRGIDAMLECGVCAIDGLLTCGQGQRIGIFAAAGCGKTTLMHSLLRHARADVCVVGLVGERGREVTEFVEQLQQDASASARTVLVYATSDQPSVDRANAAQLATTLAEYFRDQGLAVLLFIDSVTRYARALRDVALAAGELPARRGYPASVFDQLPRLLERPGRTQNGSITAFYTVLIESEDETDPIGEEVRSILDGHLYLSRKLAGRGHFPAIDILASASRLFQQITSEEQQQMAYALRSTLSRLDEMQLALDLGEYRPGENPDNDRALQLQPALNAFLCQAQSVSVSFARTLEEMHALVA